MYYPVLTAPEVFRETVDTFGGYNHNERIADGEFWDMENLTSDHFPVLSPRKGRAVYAQPDNPQGLTAREGLCYVDGSAFVTEAGRVELGLSTAPEHCPKQIVAMGAYAVIFPDKKYVNTLCLSDWGALEADFSLEGPVIFSPCDQDGNPRLADFVQPEAPEEPANMALWLDTSDSPVLKQWSGASQMWITVDSTCVRISAPGIGRDFRQYDGVCLAGMEENTALASLAGDNILWQRGEDFVVVSGLLAQELVLDAGFRMTRTVPDMDFVVESGNRLWGCRWGSDGSGGWVNEILCSKLGDFRNWRCFMGLSTDSYAVSVGSDGPFTGAAVHMGYPLFFKESCLYKVYGSYPANFHIQHTPCRGVQRGSGGSLAILGETLYYKSPRGVCAYDGALPTEISRPLGDVSYSGAVAAAYGGKYYISMENEAGDSHLFVYDAARNLWHRESGIRARAMCACREGLYAISGDGKILSLGGGDGETVQWMAQTGALCGHTSDARYLTGLHLRMALGKRAKVDIYLRYDSLGPWELVGSVTGRGQGSFSLPLRPRRCDHLHILLRGQGEARIYSMTKTLEQGSDV